MAGVVRSQLDAEVEIGANHRAQELGDHAAPNSGRIEATLAGRSRRSG
ncbi:hypothetical protein [Rhizobium sullae]|nr:hypothetical protein [Rhizobium sullae]